MQLTLQGISKRVGSQTWLHEMSIAPQEGAVTVLLGATQAGKTSLMRIMAGLDAPSAGQVRVDGRSVLGVPVRERQVAMVYQQFINYPSLRVRDNIGSPLRLRGKKASNNGCSPWLKNCTSRCCWTVIPPSCRAVSNSASPWRVPWPRAHL